MSTTPISTWAVDLADVTFIYPAVGTEFALTILCVVLWIGWHVWQVKHENKTFEEEIRKYGTPENLHKGIDHT